MARPRTGTLIWTKGSWHCRVANGPLVNMHTTLRDVAKMRAATFAAGTTPAPSPGAERFDDAAARIIAEDGARTINERASRVRRHISRELGTMPVTTIRPQHISAVLAKAAATGLSRGTLRHLQTDLSKIFGELVKDGVLSENPALAARLRVPKGRTDSRKRTLVTDEEFAAMLAAPVSFQFLTMAVCSRCLGGMRPSDLYAWKWQDVDTQRWSSALIPRPKTDADRLGLIRLRLPNQVARLLLDWWVQQGCPAKGAVFPRRLDRLAELTRGVLWCAGCRRPELHEDTQRSLRADFYSFRRAFVTAVAAAGTNAQTAMKLAGHTQLATHQGYNQPTVLTVPEAALPPSTL